MLDGTDSEALLPSFGVPSFDPTRRQSACRNVRPFVLVLRGLDALIWRPITRRKAVAGRGLPRSEQGLFSTWLFDS